MRSFFEYQNFNPYKATEDFNDFGKSMAIFDAAPIGMAIADLDGILLKVNNPFCETIGYDRSEILGRSFTIFTHPDDLELNLKRNLQLKKGEIPSHQLEKRYISKDGSIIHAIMKVSTLGGYGGSPKYLLAQVIDITDKVHLLNQKEQSEKEFREIFEQATTGMIHTNADLDIIRSNKAACLLLEYDCKELVGRNLCEFDLKDEDPELQLIRHAESEGKNYTKEKKYLTKSGRILETILKVTYLRDREILCQITDISSLKEYERLLKSKFTELQKVNNELDNFIYRASHDLKGPVATIKGLMNLKEIQSIDDKILEGFRFSIQKMENVIRELIEFSDNSKHMVLNEEIDIKEIIDECIEVLKFHPGFSRIKFIREIRNGASYHGDARRLKLVINHLIINAIDYSDPNKDQSFIRIVANSKNGNSELMVVDNGIGMREEVCKKACDMFYRGTELSKGSGLGLYLVKETIAKLNGTVALDSNPGKGTSVRMTWPG